MKLNTLTVTTVYATRRTGIENFILNRGAAMRLRKITPNVTALDMRDATVIFFKEELLAIRSGGAVYTAKLQRTPSETKALDYLAMEGDIEVYPVCRIGEDEMRYIMGSELTRHGLPMTRRERSSPTGRTTVNEPVMQHKVPRG